MPSRCGMLVYILVTSSEIILVFGFSLIFPKWFSKSVVSLKNVGNFSISGWIL